MDRLTADIGLAGRGAKRYGSNLTPTDLIKNRNFNDGKTARNRTGANGGITFAQFAAAGMKAAMRGFEFGFRQDGPNPFGPGLQESEDANPRIILFGRRYAALSSVDYLAGADLGPPNEKAIALVYRQIPRDPHVILPLDGSNTVGSGPMVEPGFTFQGTACLAATIEQWNFAYASLQKEWADKDYEAYLKIRPIHLWNGFPRDLDMSNRMIQRMSALRGFKASRGWSIDGTVMITAGTDGSAPQHLNGFRTNPDGTVSGGSAVKSYHVTVAAKGQVSMFDYSLGQGMTERARVHLVLRKCHPNHYDRISGGSRDLSYNLMQKGVDEQRDGTGMTRTVSGTIKTRDDKEEILFCPFQLCVVCDPTGKSHLDQEYGEYIDENGDQWYDGHIMPVSVVFSAPIHINYVPPPAPDDVRPVMDGRKVIGRDPYEAILDPDDGLRSIF